MPYRYYGEKERVSSSWAHSLGGIQLSIQISTHARIMGRHWRRLMKIGVKSWLYLQCQHLVHQGFWVPVFFFNVALKHCLSWFLSFLAAPHILSLRQVPPSPHPSLGLVGKKNLNEEQNKWPSFCDMHLQRTFMIFYSCLSISEWEEILYFGAWTC